MDGDLDSWEARMAARARQREADKAAAHQAEVERQISASGAEAWLNGWPIISTTSVLMGCEVRCMYCGRSEGTTTVAFPKDWTPPGPEPKWPFSVADCPICGRGK